MRLAKLEEFRRLIYTPESAPALSTLRRRIREIPGGTVERRHYYVDLDEYDRQTQLRAGITARLKQLEADPRLEGLL